MAEHDIFQNGKIGYQHEMLMNHPDSPANGIGRMANRSGLAVNADQAAIGGVKSIENADKGGFSSAIFPDDTVNMARHDL